jgi:hypothetical protein
LGEQGQLQQGEQEEHPSPGSIAPRDASELSLLFPERYPPTIVRSRAKPLDFFHTNRLNFARQQEGGLKMELSAPTTPIFIISLVLAVLAIIGQFVPIPFITDYGFWTAIVAYVVLAIGNVFRGV